MFNHRLAFFSMTVRFIIIISLCFYSLCATAQNLILNGGLEDVNTCTEYRVECAPEAWISSDHGFSNYFRDANRAHRGEYCMAIEAGNSRKVFQRTYIRSQLVCALRPGANYRIRFFIKSPHAILDSIGILFFSTDPLLQAVRLQQLSPTAWVTDAVKTLQADSSWQEVQINYKANGKEAYLLMGNFSRKNITGSTGIPRESHFFIFVDDFSMQPADPREQLCTDWQQQMQDIYDQNERHEYLRKTIRNLQNRPDPVQLSSTILPSMDTLLLPDLLFETGKQNLHPQSHLVLDSFCRSMAGKIIDSLIIEGHTDNTGSAESNEVLSLGRAASVAGYLRSCALLFKKNIILRGWGSRKPVMDNKTPAGRQQNRRVTLIVYFKEP